MKGIYEDTLVLTRRGYVCAKEVSDTDIVLGLDNMFHQVESIERIEYSGSAISMRGMSVDSFICLPDTEIITKERYLKYNPVSKHMNRAFKKESSLICASSINRDYFPGLLINMNDTLPVWNGTEYNQYGHHRILDKLSDKFTNPHFWYIMGRYVGDGWQRKNYQSGGSYRGGIVICCVDKDIDSLIEAIEKCRYTYTKTKERTTYRVSIYSIELYEFVERYGHGASGKTIDIDTLNIPTELLKEFIHGYLDSDGAFTQGKYKLTTTSKYLAYSLGQALMKTYYTHYHIYFIERPKKYIIEGREVNQRDWYQVVWDTSREKTYKAFYENEDIWFPLKEIKHIDVSNMTFYHIKTVGDFGYNAYSIGTK